MTAKVVIKMFFFKFRQLALGIMLFQTGKFVWHAQYLLRMQELMQNGLAMNKRLFSTVETAKFP